MRDNTVNSKIENSDNTDEKHVSEVTPQESDLRNVSPTEKVSATQQKADSAVIDGEKTENGSTANVAPVSAKPRKSKMSVANIVFTSIGGVVIVFLLFVAITLAVDKFVNKSPVPSLFGTSTLIVTTGSMSGTIEEGDLIVVKKSDDYVIGDIITFLPFGDTVPTTHRIIRITDGKYFTRGDANNAEDSRFIEKDEIIGKVTHTAPHVGLFFKWLKDEFGWAYLVAFVIVIGAGIVLLKQFPATKKEK